MTTEELKAVLDLPEEEQVRFLEMRDFSVAEIGGGGVTKRYDENDKIIDVFRGDGKPLRFRRSNLADLAFRMRDEVLKSEKGTIKWVGAMFDVYMKRTGSQLLNWKWGYVKAQPIDWIVAALIAKELSKEKENGKST